MTVYILVGCEIEGEGSETVHDFAVIAQRSTTAGASARPRATSTLFLWPGIPAASPVDCAVASPTGAKRSTETIGRRQNCFTIPSPTSGSIRWIANRSNPPGVLDPTPVIRGSAAALLSCPADRSIPCGSGFEDYAKT